MPSIYPEQTTEIEQIFLLQVEELATTKLAPKLRDSEDSRILTQSVKEILFENGLMSIEVPQELGGIGGTFFMTVAAIEAIAKTDPSAAVICDLQNSIVRNFFLRWGSVDQRGRYLFRLMSEELGSMCLVDSLLGFDTSTLTAIANDQAQFWCLEGRKTMVPNAKDAEIFFVFAHTDKTAGYKGLTAFICERNMTGLTVSDLNSKEGCNQSSACEVIFDHVKVPKDNVIGEIGSGYGILTEMLNEDRICVAAQLIGLSQNAHAAAMTYARQKPDHGAERDLREYCHIDRELAEINEKIKVAQSHIYLAARLRDAGKPFAQEAAMAEFHARHVAEQLSSSPGRMPLSMSPGHLDLLLMRLSLVETLSQLRLLSLTYVKGGPS
jgi:alkylation response protein AidB-like acyl-CoA dehydrogenase